MRALITRFLVAQPVGPGSALASRLVPFTNFQSEASREELTRVINNMLEAVDSVYLVATTPFLYGESPGTSVTPAERTSLWHVCVNFLNYHRSRGYILTSTLVYRRHGVELQCFGGRDI